MIQLMRLKTALRTFGSIGAGLVVTACGWEGTQSAPSGAKDERIADYRGVTGTVIKLADFPSDYVAPRNVEIWLPPSYDKDPDKHYPVLYMHDGQNIFDPSQSRYSGIDWGVDEAMTRLVRQGAVREAIVVGIWSLPQQRNAEYMPQKAVTAQMLPLYQQELGGLTSEALKADHYLKFLTRELKPYIDQTYRTLPGREDTFIMGSSMGGLISLYAISEYPDILGGAACVSTHFPLGEGALVEYFKTRLPDPKTHKIYFDYGTKTLDHNYEPFQRRMDAYGYAAGYVEGHNWISRKFDGHEHSERAWRARVHVPLQFLLAIDDEALSDGD